jgi:type IV pilus assembly protein PilB
VDHGFCSFEEVGEAIRRRYRIGYEAPDAGSLDRGLLELVPERTCRKHGVIPRGAGHNAVSILTANPVDAQAQQEVAWAASRVVEPIFCLPDHLERLFLEMLTPDAVVYDLLARLEITAEVEVVASGGDEGTEGAAPPASEVRAPVIRLVNAILVDAVTRGASDVHVEHEEQATLVRYRVDGLLRKAMVLPRYVGAGPLVSRVKIMAGLDLAERRAPQDGRAKVRIGGRGVGLRVSTLPTALGEKIVIRVLDERSANVPLDRLGFHGDVQRRMESLLAREEGMLLVTGPTGSGKTTTLYAMLNRRRAEDVNLVTVEDPMEYRLPGVNQVQVNPRQGLSFASVLRSVLRQDPDVIMVGEIRDGETADVACQAALTGHLVLSTLHTNDTVTSVARLADMGVERFKIASGLIGATAQRLVRRVCTSCSREVTARSVSAELDHALRARGLGTTVRAAVGCPACDHVGYKGRLSVVELLEVDGGLRGLIASGADADELRRAASASGVLHTMTDDILRHLADGHTTPEEVAPYLHLDPTSASAPHLPPGGHAPRGAHGSAATNALPSRVARAPARVVLAVGDANTRSELLGGLAVMGVHAVAVEGTRAALAEIVRADPALLVLGTDPSGARPLQLVEIARGALGLRDLPILALARSEADAEELLAAGADDFLLLPLHPEETRARLRAVLNRNQRWAPPQEVMTPRPPAREADRVAELRRFSVLDTAPEERFDRLTRQAAHHFGAPIALVSLVDSDRQWFKSRHGVESEGTPRDISFCGHAILGEDVFVVEDALLDARFVHNPLVTADPHIRFYAGYPLRGPGGHRVGSFCVIDQEPRTVSADDLRVLSILGRQVEAELRAGARGA